MVGKMDQRAKHSVLYQPNILRHILMLLFVLVAFLVLQGIFSTKASAYQHGYLIDDAIFLDAKSMNASQIQNFLNSKSGVLKSRSFKLDCDAPGIGSTSKQLYIQAGAPCGSTIPASQIIYYTAQVYGVSPKVIIATLQKEQSLITDSSPSARAINQAMGYACPTSGVCDSNSSFFWQIDNGTWVMRFHFERARKNNNWWYTSSSWTCGTAKTNYYSPNLYPRQNVKFYDPYSKVNYVTVYIQNAATSAFYCYTPHVFNNHSNSPHPDDAKNPRCYSMHPASGNKGRCYTGSYNFVKAYENWFGSTLVPWKPVDIPRWMEVKVDTYKKDPMTGENAEDALIPAGTQIYFESKITIDGKLYVRSTYSHNRAEAKAFLASELKEIDLVYGPMDIPRWMEIGPGSVRKTDPRTEKNIYDVIPEGYQAYFDERITIGGKLYLRTKTDKILGRDRILAYDSLRATTVEYQDFNKPRWMEIAKSTHEYDIKEQTQAGSQLTANTHLFLNKKIIINGVEYYRNNLPGDATYHAGIPAADLKELTVKFVNLDRPRAFKLKNSIHKKDPVTGNNIEVLIEKGRVIYFPTKTIIGDTLYFRSLYDTQRNQPKVMPADAFEEIPVLFEPMIKPRELITTRPTHKNDPVTLQNIEAIPKNTKAIFSERITIGDELYLRTRYNTNNQQLLVIPFSHLAEL